jgi:hypothetical protein
MPAADAPLPIRVGRRGRPSKPRDNARSRQAGTHTVGGGLVGSMKRGLAVRRPSKLERHRTTLLCESNYALLEAGGSADDLISQWGSH